MSIAAVGERIMDKARAVRLLACDVDGVLTDGQLRFHADGDTIVEGKSFSILDGFGIRLLQETGVAVALITGRRSPVVAHRAREMGIRHLVEGADDKKPAWMRLLSDLGLAAAECAYVGDDWLDLPVMTACGLGIAVPNAPELVRRHADHVTEAAGGRGAVREVCELIMHAQGTLEARFAAYLHGSAAARDGARASAGAARSDARGDRRSAAGPSQGAGPLGGAARSDARGDRPSAAGPSQGAGPLGGAARSDARGDL